MTFTSVWVPATLLSWLLWTATQVIAQVTGAEPLPWEHPETALACLRQLKVLRRSVLACVNRDPAARPAADELLGSWLNVFDATTVAPGAADCPTPASDGARATTAAVPAAGAIGTEEVTASGESITDAPGQTFAEYDRDARA
jgi:hypothetical protein